MNVSGKKLELLAPAGSRRAFYAALNSGADAIYLGVDKFSARRQAENFSLDELDDVVREAHLKDVKIYVAFNTIIADGELDSAVESLARINNAGVDSVIIQDWGIFKLVKEYFPELKIHASTQMNTHNLAMVKMLDEAGASRITLARELAIDEIKEICGSTDRGIETFIHGALCFSYSGQCLFSSMVGNRSGNRGMCPQACRMSYSLLSAGKKDEVWPTPGDHILSTKDLAGINLIPQLAQSGVSALKIEGRMKSPEYVATVVRVYRHAIDRYLADPDGFEVSETELDELREVFSRGFTEGYFNEIKDDRLMSYFRPSDRGILLGRVTYLDVYTARLGLQINRELCVGDEIEVWVSRGGRVRNKVEKLFVDEKQVECAPAGSKAVIIIDEKRHKINTGDRVFRVHNERLIQTARAAITGGSTQKTPIELSAQVEIGESVEITAHVSGRPNDAARVVSDFKAEKGERRTLAEADVIAQLDRLGNTVYEAVAWDVRVGEGVMVPLGQLNELRRELIDALDAVRLKAQPRTKVSVGKARQRLQEDMVPEKSVARRKPVISVDISTVKQAAKAVENGADWLYVKPGFTRQVRASIEEISKIAAPQGVRIALASGNILHQAELTAFMKYARSNKAMLDALLVDNFGVNHEAKALGLPVFTDYHINNFNTLSTRLFRDDGASRICLSAELALEQIKDIAGAVDVELEAIVHGWLEVMTTEHCVVSAGKESCSACESRLFYIEDNKEFRFPVEQDTKCRSHIYNSRELYLLPNVKEIIDAGVTSLRLVLDRYEPQLVGGITSAYKEAVDLIHHDIDDISKVVRRAEKLFPRDFESTTGHYFRPVQ
ncbi:MAG: U32 family peptidase [Candidatus Aquicultor sp.]|nr:U32 family peptidase [Candidatus Aquicultor sp.]